MLGSNPSADSVASTDSGGMLRHPLSSVCRQGARIGRGTKALNPGGAGAKPPLPARPQASLRNRAPSDNACIAPLAISVAGSLQNRTLLASEGKVASETFDALVGDQVQRRTRAAN
jgi:hypothetical protein